MNTTLIYSNLVQGLVQKLSKMEEAGIIGTFSSNLIIDSKEDKGYSNWMSVSYNMPDGIYGDGIIFIDGKDEYDAKEVDRFNEGLNDLVRDFYKVSIRAKESKKYVEDNFKDIISAEMR